MAPRPFPQSGNYVRVKGRRHLQGYDAPPRWGGRRLGWVAEGTCLGPIRRVEHTHCHVSVLVRGWWLNVWTSKGYGTMTIVPVPECEVSEWKERGWQDIYQRCLRPPKGPSVRWTDGVPPPDDIAHRFPQWLPEHHWHRSYDPRCRRCSCSSAGDLYDDSTWWSVERASSS